MLRTILPACLLSVVASTAFSATSTEATYDTRYSNGNVVQVGTLGGLEVRMSAWKGNDLQIMLFIQNDTDQRITFFPEQVAVESIRHGADGTTKALHVRTFSANEYESKMQNNLAWNTFFSAMRNWETAEPEKYTVTGASAARYYDWSEGTTVTERRAFAGTITRQPTQSDRMAAEDRSRARVDRDMAPMRQRAADVSAGLMRAQTLEPHSFYGGMVYAKTNGPEYAVSVPFGGTAFRFPITFGRPMSAEAVARAGNKGAVYGTAQVGAVLPEGGVSETEKNGLSGGVAFDYFVSGSETIGLCGAIEKFKGGENLSYPPYYDYAADAMQVASAGVRFTHQFGTAPSGTPYLILGSSVYRFSPSYVNFDQPQNFIKWGFFGGIGLPIRLGRSAGLGLEVVSHHPTMGDAGGLGWYLKTQATLRFRMAGGH